MKDFIIIFLFIITIILFIILLCKKYKINEINKNIELENEKLIKNKYDIINEIKFLNKTKEEKDNDLKQVEKIINNMKIVTSNAFEQYCDGLNLIYSTKEKEWDEAVNLLKESYAKIQMNLLEQQKQIQKELDKISATRAAAVEAQLKEQEIKNKQSFYCPQISEADLKDAKILRDIEYKLNNPRVLRMLIWQTYYQKSINQVCANVLGGNSIEKCGIYKITNQKTDLVYIGQAVDIATRWKNHAKAGLGIDTPVGNKLYKAMLEYGLENFSFEILEECKRTELNEKEKFYINLYQSDKYGYNSNSGINK